MAGRVPRGGGRANPGDFLEYTIGDQSILVVRGDDGVDPRVRPTTASTAGRGSRPASATSPTAQIRCRYHAWQYALDGELVEVVDREEFTGLPDGLAPRRAARRVLGRVRVRQLRIPTPSRCSTSSHPIPKLLDRYHLDQMRFRSYQTTILPANWKVVVDAFNEGYHVQGTHPQLLAWTDDVGIEYEQFETHARYGRLEGARRAAHAEPAARPARPTRSTRARSSSGARRRARRRVPRRGARARRGAARVDAAGRVARRVPEAGASSCSRRAGLDVSELGDELMTSADDVYWFPNLVGPIYPGQRDPVPRPAQRPRSRLRDQGHVGARVARARIANAPMPKRKFYRRLARARLGRSSRPRTTRTCSRCRRA